ncbi:hypothetical protein CLOSTMETH_03238 [[Clostridium] methylpentosum DSM 5476]|uniref:Uncharacterized protein n=1 Tax=[Clostridium] methylpentosum DSM 5476 TaxID=537013 RepID=C0EH38_9FIRM|nr:hypothetical protein CLOSTMETH_03238 [[Clostridium] methylpentosum DSM 5476]
MSAVDQKPALSFKKSYALFGRYLYQQMDVVWAYFYLQEFDPFPVT